MTRGDVVLPALASALLLILSYPPLHLLLPPFVALVPFAVAVAGLPAEADGPRRAFRAGAIVGAVSWGVLLYWIVVALLGTPMWALPAWAAAVVVLALLTGAVGWALHRLRHRLRVPLWLALPLAWTAGEWVRAHLPGPFAFPWLELGVSLSGWPELLGIAEVVGGRGVTFWLALVAGLLSEAVRALVTGRGTDPAGRGTAGSGPRSTSTAARSRSASSAAGWAVTALAVAAAGAGWGVWRAAALPVRDALRVAVVQPGVAHSVKQDPAAVVDATLASVDRLVPRVEAAMREGGPFDVVVLPEALLPVPLDGPDGAALVARLAAHAARLGAPLLLGGIGREAGQGGVESGRPPRFHNSVFAIDSAGLRPTRYDKRRLVPFVERVPLLPGVRRLEAMGEERGLWAASYEPGTGWPLFSVHGAEVGAFVCFESAFPEVARALRRAGADVLVNVTNDAWYGRDAWYGQTIALWQHPAHLVLRAVEMRVGVVRAANTGVSLVVDPTGHTRGETPFTVEAVATGVVRTTDVVTAFARFGDVAGTGAFLAVVVLLLSGRLRDRLRGGTSTVGEGSPAITRHIMQKGRFPWRARKN